MTVRDQPSLYLKRIPATYFEDSISLYNLAFSRDIKLRLNTKLQGKFQLVSELHLSMFAFR
jgi:hypothetical protein